MLHRANRVSPPAVMGFGNRAQVSNTLLPRPAFDLAQIPGNIRMVLFDEFLNNTVRRPNAANLRD